MFSWSLGHIGYCKYFGFIFLNLLIPSWSIPETIAFDIGDVKIWHKLYQKTFNVARKFGILPLNSTKLSLDFSWFFMGWAIFRTFRGTLKNIQMQTSHPVIEIKRGSGKSLSWMEIHVSLPEVAGVPSGYDIHSSPWKITMLLIGKPSISMGHLYHGYVK